MEKKDGNVDEVIDWCASSLKHAPKWPLSNLPPACGEELVELQQAAAAEELAWGVRESSSASAAAKTLKSAEKSVRSQRSGSSENRRECVVEWCSLGRLWRGVEGAEKGALSSRS